MSNGISRFRDGGSFAKDYWAPPVAGANSDTSLSAAIDRTMYNSAKLVAAVGAISGSPSDSTITVKLTECDTSGGLYTDVSGSTLTLTAAGSTSVDLDLTGCKRYLKVDVAVAHTSGSSPKAPTVGGIFLCGNVNNPAE